ncbi:GL21414, partial [Drosophila persimilis]
PSGRFSYNESGLSCNNLLTDDITNSVRCAQKVLSQQEWSAWSTWKYCDGSLPSINDCF